MYAFSMFASLALLLAARLVHASVYVTNPVQSSTCMGGQSCSVEWVDNGQTPLLSAIGECDVALYTGELQLAQSLPSVDVSATQSFTFTVDPNAGPSGQYYIVFTNSAINYQGFSGSFTLNGMTGTTPGGGSSTTPATSSAGSSTSAGSTTPTTTGPATTLSGTTTSPTATLTTPTVTTPKTSATSVSTTVTSASTSASASSTNAAVRLGSSTSVGGIAALFLLSGVLAF